MKHNLNRLIYFFIVLAVALAVRPPTAQAETQSTGVTERVSVASDGTQANDNSSIASISANKRYVAFSSDATNLVSGDTNGWKDVFVYDRQTGVTERVSVASGGTQAKDGSSNPSISADGRYVAFDSWSDDLVDNDTNSVDDVFVHDRQTGVTERVSVASDGSQGTSYSENPSISADGRYVAFQSNANNLVDNDTNLVVDIFVHDRQTGVTERVSVASDGTQGETSFDANSHPSISADGRYVAFLSDASNLVAGDTNNRRDIFIHDRQTGVTERVSVKSDGTQANGDSTQPSISADGRYVAFVSQASNLVIKDYYDSDDIFVHDRQTGLTEMVSIASDGTQAYTGGDSHYPSISADGRYVAFTSDASKLVASDTNEVGDIFVHDRQTGVTERVSIASDGTQANDLSFSPSISADGRYVAFQSYAANLVAGDTNGMEDVFIHDRMGIWNAYIICLPALLK